MNPDQEHLKISKKKSEMVKPKNKVTFRTSQRISWSIMCEITSAGRKNRKKH